MDWATFGTITAGFAPYVAARANLAPDPFVTAAAAFGGVSGAAVGALVWAVDRRLPERSRVAVAAVLWPPALGGWGAAVAAAAAYATAPSMVEFAVLCGSVSGLVQTAWFAPAYTLQARRGGRRWPLLALSPLGALLGGAAAVFVTFSVLDL